MAVYVDKPAVENVNVRLKTHEYLDDFSDVEVTGGFNNWLPATAVPMTKNPDGTYSAAVDSKSDTLAYRLINAAKGDTVEGTDADGYVYNGYEGYNSLIFAKPGKVKIIFNPAKLVKSSLPVKVTFQNSASLTAQFADAYNLILNNRLAVRSAFQDFKKSGKDIKNYKFDFSKEVDSFNAAIKKTKYDIVKNELRIGYLEFKSFNPGPDTALSNAVKKIPPSSILWSLNPSIIPIACSLAFGREGKENLEEYMKQFVSRNNSILVKSTTLFSLFVYSKMQKKPDDVAGYYNTLITQYANTSIGKMVKEYFPDAFHVKPGSPFSYLSDSSLAKAGIPALSDSNHVKVGSPVPSFSFISLDDSSKFVNNDSMKGKYYMIDFWATWCGPCVGEMKSLHAAYEKYKNKNFTIISVSLDKAPEDIIKFRNNKWKMPWFNSFISGSDRLKIAKDFYVYTIPAPVLVNEKGIVVAIQEDLRGENLDKTLGNLLSK